jgi:hypothetical protein
MKKVINYQMEQPNYPFTFIHIFEQLYLRYVLKEQVRTSLPVLTFSKIIAIASWNTSFASSLVPELERTRYLIIGTY